MILNSDWWLYISTFCDSSQDKLQLEWNNLVDWSNTVNLPLNVSKCCVLDFVTKKNMSLSQVNLTDGSILKNVSSFRLLGVTFSNDMKWNLHIESIVKRARRRFYAIYHLRRSDCPTTLMFRFYVSFIRSVLLFAFPCFCNCPDYLLQKLLYVERRIFKIIGSSDFTKFPDAANSMCFKLMSSIVNNPHHPLRVMFLSNNNTISTRHTKTIRPPFARTSRFSESFTKFCK